MEKLTELLREYNMSNQSPYILGDADYYVDDVLYAPQIISKSYGFIEWLVESEKIDLYKLPIRLEEYYQNTEAVGYITDDESILLMELAIQDEPISFLVSLLK